MIKIQSLAGLLLLASLLAACDGGAEGEATSSTPQPAASVPAGAGTQAPAGATAAATASPSPTATATASPSATSTPAATASPTLSATAARTATAAVATATPAATAVKPNCDPNYTGACIPPFPPDLDCGQIAVKRFRSVGSDPHRLDGDKDGIACE